MTDFNQVARDLDPETYQRLKTAIELRKWPNGERLTDEQLKTCMQAVITYEANNVPEEERTGYMEQSCESSKNDEVEGLISSDQNPAGRA